MASATSWHCPFWSMQGRCWDVGQVVIFSLYNAPKCLAFNCGVLVGDGSIDKNNEK